MANCREIEEKLAEYVEGEQATPERAAVDAHLEACPPCRTRVAAERAARDLVCSRRQELRATAPEALRYRCASQRSAAAPSFSVLRRRPWVPLSFAATLVLAAALFLLFGWGSSVETYAAQLSADHLKCFQFPPEVTASPDVTLLGRDWQESSGWGLKVPSSSVSEGLQLLTIRRCGSSRGRVAHILYKWHGEPLSVYVLNHRFDRAADADQDHDVTRLGEHAIVWSAHERTYAVIADHRLADLHRVATYVRRSIE
jgi:anti-sigma factor RsiW